jgi:hypothetical protein
MRNIFIFFNKNNGVARGNVNVQCKKGLTLFRSEYLMFTQQPVDGDTVQLDSHIYEFSSDHSVASGHVKVAIGSTLADTVRNFQNASVVYYRIG